MNAAQRIFRRLEYAPASVGIYNPYFLDRFAYVQMNNKGNFLTGPSMELVHATSPYSYWEALGGIEYGLRYFMRPYTFTAFGRNEKDTDKPYLLVRAWLQHKSGTNHVAVTVERVMQREGRAYLNTLNYKTVWEPSDPSWDTAAALHQTLTRTNPDGWETRINCQK